MSSDIVIKVDRLSKCYHIYSNPRDRLKQMLWRGRRQFYQEFWALKDISFEVRKGETVGIIGRNGSGKSTLLQLICGTLNPVSGSIQTQGRIAALLELGSGFNPEFTGRENVYLNAELLGLTPSEIDERYEDIVAFADIGEFINQPVKTYSSGMYLRLAFAVIAHVDADILVIDEALAVGDAFFTQKCMRFLNKFKQEHSLLFVSHDAPAVISLCDQAVWLEQGSMKAFGDSKTVCEQYNNSLFESLEKNDDGATGKNEVANLARIGGDQAGWRDLRSEFVNASSLRNDIQIFAFRSDESHDYGGSEARIVSVALLDSTGARLSWVVGGEKVCLQIEIQCNVGLQSPIAGFSVKDRLGQTLFGDNTYLSFLSQPHSVTSGETLVVEFEFFMPWLAGGDYVIQAAVAEGTQESHRQLHWVHDALKITSHHTAVSTGLIGIPMCDIRMSEK
ncbi:ABC transporter ATP-binding protein [Candidatus Saccharibacteria bacterium]|nr:ABC transporter ATP-binding protein [Candidatus Saccharibacteria bacterium]